jgi:methenyltetrahydrofolate cyclohydrolase
MSGKDSTWTIEGLAATVADPERFAGGGAVAAMSLAGASATAELVFTLSARRSSLSDRDRERLNLAIESCRRGRSNFIEAIDADIAALSELMEAISRSRRSKSNPSDPNRRMIQRAFDEATGQAIEIPLGVAREANLLLEAIEDLQHLARSFTMSDLGAAAATIEGGVTSLLLMAEVNLGMIESDDERSRLAAEIRDIGEQSSARARTVIDRTRAAIRPDSRQEG